MSTVYCLVDDGGKTYVKEGARSFADVAAEFGLDESACQKYRFDASNADALMKFAMEGRLPKQILMGLLAFESRPAFADACERIEKRYTELCTAKNDPCLESGCSLEGEECLEPLLAAGVDYHKACAAEWIKLFRNPRNRAAA
jgi:hypothetical protein